jgi:single-stranded-DNA-specific exonuclease
MDRAVERINRALDSSEILAIYGDYDVDGVTSAALLGRVLSKLARNPEAVLARVPHRSRDGYGLSPDTIDQLHAEGATLIISADCGISAHEAAERAKATGVDLIITDHHEPGDCLPDAYAVINPKRADTRYPFRELAGVGVAFKLGEAVAARRGIPAAQYQPRFLDLVALGTVADSAPLMDENRAMVKQGLAAMSQTRKAGLRALLGAVGAFQRPISAGTISFQVAPRLNAVGRVDDAAIALELLMTSDTQRAQEHVALLERLNDQRREEQERIWGEALQHIQKNGLSEDKVLVVHGRDWHRGVVGIVAGRLADRFHRPALVMAADDIMARGSARSAANFPVIEALRDCHALLSDFGGHSQAAGFDLRIENIPELRLRLNEFADRYLSDEDVIPCLDVDMEVTPAEICGQTLRDLMRMEPFGAGNREPLWVARNLKVVHSSRFGKQNDRPHLSLKMRGDGMDITECVWWRMATRQAEFPPESGFDVAFRMEPNHFGNGALRLNVQDIAPSESSGDTDFGDVGPDREWDEAA